MSLFVLGIGSARPATNIDSVAPSDRNTSGKIRLSCGRRSVLSNSYLNSTNNLDASAAYQAAIEDPTGLAHRAAQQALDRAGLEAAQIGMIIGDTSTPHQTTPSEAQRLGKMLGTKVPAFDLASSGAALLHQIGVLSSWKPHRIADYTMIVSTNTPTENLLFGPEARNHDRYFCDGAAALVCSSKHVGKLKVVDAFMACSPQDCGLFGIDTYGYLNISANEFRKVFARVFVGLYRKAFDSCQLNKSKLRLVSSFLEHDTLQFVARELGENPDSHFFSGVMVGADSLGATPGMLLSECWDNFSAGEQILAISIGAGVSFGYVLFEGVSNAA